MQQCIPCVSLRETMKKDSIAKPTVGQISYPLRVKALSYFAPRYRTAPVILFILFRGAARRRWLGNVADFETPMNRSSCSINVKTFTNSATKALKTCQEFETAKTAVVANRYRMFLKKDYFTSAIKFKAQTLDKTSRLLLPLTTPPAGASACVVKTDNDADKELVTAPATALLPLALILSSGCCKIFDAPSKIFSADKHSIDRTNSATSSCLQSML
uniref:Uncharacterized protein n=1 Tax=Romanomermis culicivorax TaxID=13658 RepID=A0A915JBZ0_ROMCU